MKKQPDATYDNDLLALYLADVGRYALLTAEDEIRLAQEIERGNAARVALEESRDRLTPEERRDLRRSVRRGTEAWETFVQSNLRLVVSIAKKYSASGVPLLDLIQDGNLGLMHAVGKFDWRKGFKFSTYATWWIREAIERGIGVTKNTIRLPRDVGNQVKRLRSTQTRIEATLGRPASNAELATELGLPEKRIEELIRYAHLPLSLSEPLGGYDRTLLDLVEDRTTEPSCDAALNPFTSAIVENLLSQLDERERRIISLRYGLDGSEPRTYAEVASHFTLTRERIRQIEVKATARLRDEVAGMKACDLLDA